MSDSADIQNPREAASRKKLAGPLVVALVTAAVLLPFVNKPYHIDDTLFLKMAEQIETHPLAPLSFEYVWNFWPRSMWRNSQNPPLNGYLVFLAGSAWHYAEPIVHLFYLALAVGCALAMYWLASRFCAHPTWATLITVITPAFLVSATNVMADIPLLLFWLLAICATVQAIRTHRDGWLWMAGIAASLAVMTKYFGIAVVPLLAVYWFLASRRLSVHLWGLSVPVVVLLVWGIYSQMECGFFHPLGAAGYSIGDKSIAVFFQNTTDTLTYLGGSIFWCILLMPAVIRLPFGLKFALLAVCLAAFFGCLPQLTPFIRAEYVAMSLGGGTLLLMTAAGLRARLDADAWLLALWCFGTLAFSGFVNWSVNVRTLLPAVFPATVLVFRWLESLEPGAVWMCWLKVSALPTLAVSLMVAAGDYQLAWASKTFAETTARKLVAEGKSVAFAGHWGFQYYMEREGAQPIDYRAGLIRPADYYVYPQANSNVRKLNYLRETVVKKDFENPFYFQTMCAECGAGFYSSRWGSLPFGISTQYPVESYVVDRFLGRKFKAESTDNVHTEESD